MFSVTWCFTFVPTFFVNDETGQRKVWFLIKLFWRPHAFISLARSLLERCFSYHFFLSAAKFIRNVAKLEGYVWDSVCFTFLPLCWLIGRAGWVAGKDQAAAPRLARSGAGSPCSRDVRRAVWRASVWQSRLCQLALSSGSARSHRSSAELMWSLVCKWEHEICIYMLRGRVQRTERCIYV